MQAMELQQTDIALIRYHEIIRLIHIMHTIKTVLKTLPRNLYELLQ